MCPDWGLNLQPRYLPNQELNLRPFGVWDKAPPTEPHQPGLDVLSGGIQTKIPQDRIQLREIIFFTVTKLPKRNKKLRFFYSDIQMSILLAQIS